MKTSGFFSFPNPNRLENLWFFLTLLWVLPVFYHYFISGHDNPLQPWSSLTVLGGVDIWICLKSFLVFLKFLAVAVSAFFTIWSWGRKICRWMGFPGKSSFLKLPLEAGMGIVFFNALWLGLGLNFLWVESLWKGLAFFLLLWALRDITREFHVPVPWKRIFTPLPGFFPFFLILSLIFYGVLCLAHGLAPDTYYDSLVYHGSVLSGWKFHHGICDFPANLYSYYPFGGELYFANGFFLQGTESAKLLNIFLIGACAAMAAGWVGESVNSTGAWITLGMIAAFPMLPANAWTAHTEVILSFFILLFFYCLWRIIEREGAEDNPCFILGLGLFGGAALSVKYTAFPPLAIGLLVLGLKKKFLAGKNRWILWAAALLFITLQIAPWFLRNYLLTGNPFYPYLSSAFSGRKISPLLMGALLNDHMATLYPGEPLWKIPVSWFSIGWGKAGGPLLFAFIPFLILGFIRKKVPQWLSLSVGFYFVLGFSISLQLRLMIPAFILFFLLAGWVMGSIENRLWAKTWAGVVIVYGFLSLGTLLSLSLHFYQLDGLWLKGWSREEYLRQLPLTSTYFDLAEKCGEIVAPGNRLLIAGDARGLYYPRPFITNSTFDDQVLARLTREEKDALGIQRRLRQMGVDDLVVSATEGIRLAPQLSYYHLNSEEWKRLDEFMKRGTNLLYTGPHGAIYQVRRELGPKDRLKPDLLLLFSNPAQGIQKKLRI